MTNAAPYTAQMPAQREIVRSGVHTALPEHVGFRLRRLDGHNWTIERYVEPGRKKNGKVSAGRWTVDGYYPSLETAALRLFDKMLLAGEPTDTAEELIAAVEAARKSVIQAVKEAS